jgi:hypothetical protein
VEKLLADLPDADGPVPAERAGPPDEVTDMTGSIRVRVARDGLPASIEVGPDWRRAIGCDGFAGAVNAACMMAAGAAAEDRVGSPGENFLAQLENLSAVVDQALGWVSRGVMPREVTGMEALRSIDEMQAMWDAAGIRPPGRLEEAQDDALRAFDATGTPDAAQALPDFDTPANGRLSLTIIMSRLVTCAANADWVNMQDHHSLTEALRTALAAARAEQGGMRR